MVSQRFSARDHFHGTGKRAHFPVFPLLPSLPRLVRRSKRMSDRRRVSGSRSPTTSSRKTGQRRNLAGESIDAKLYPDIADSWKTRLAAQHRKANGRHVLSSLALFVLSSSVSCDRGGCEIEFRGPSVVSPGAGRPIWQTLYVPQIPFDASCSRLRSFMSSTCGN